MPGTTVSKRVGALPRGRTWRSGRGTRRDAGDDADIGRALADTP